MGYTFQCCLSANDSRGTMYAGMHENKEALINFLPQYKPERVLKVFLFQIKNKYNNTSLT